MTESRNGADGEGEPVSPLPAESLTRDLTRDPGIMTQRKVHASPTEPLGCPCAVHFVKIGLMSVLGCARPTDGPRPPPAPLRRPRTRGTRRPVTGSSVPPPRPISPCSQQAALRPLHLAEPWFSRSLGLWHHQPQRGQVLAPGADQGRGGLLAGTSGKDLLEPSRAFCPPHTREQRADLDFQSAFAQEVRPC